MRPLTIALAVIAAATLATGCETDGAAPAPVQTTPVQEGAGEKDGGEKDGGEKGGTVPGEKVTVEITARHAQGKGTVLSDGGDLSCVRVVITNRREGELAVNPLYFSLIDTKGEKHEASDAIAQYEGQIAITDLAPGEKIEGNLCGQGEFTPKTVAMTDEFMKEQARAEVA